MKKNNILLIVLFLVGVFYSYGQENTLIQPKSIENQSLKSASIPNVLGYAKQPEPVHINLNALEQADSLQLSFDKKKIWVKMDQFTIRDDNDLSYSANSSEKISGIVMSVLDNDIQGVIYDGDDVYEVITSSPGEYAVVKIDPSQYPEGDCFIEAEDSGTLKSRGLEPPKMNDMSSQSNFSLQQTPGNFECKIRVLALYTPAAEAKSSNIKNNIRLHVDAANQTFRNSGINYEIELVYFGRTDYDESKGYLLKRFHNRNDGYMDELHELCDIYSADLRVLICDMRNSCGVAYVNSVSSVVDYACIGNYAFAHELGHNLGCLHDRYTASQDKLYSHGYVYVPGKWKTIMSYNGKCRTNGVSCTTIPFWSNPNNNYNRVPMGTDTYENCVRVWNEKSMGKMRLHQPFDSVFLSNEDMPNTLFADLVAKQTIETSDSLTLNVGLTLNTRAGHSITLSPGFTAEEGAEFSATIEPVSDCGLTESNMQSEALAYVQDEMVVSSDYSTPSVFSYRVGYSYLDDLVHIEYELYQEMPVLITLIDKNGSTVSSVVNEKALKAGRHRAIYDTSHLYAGNYKVQINAGGKHYTKDVKIRKSKNKKFDTRMRETR